MTWRKGESLDEWSDRMQENERGQEAGEGGVTAEIWRPVPEFPGYEASSLGRVRNVKRGEPRILRLNVNPRTTYLQVTMYPAGGRSKVKPVHRIIGETFLGPRPPKLETRHLNGDKYDNRAENLRYGTHSENMLDQVRCGTHYEASKTVCRNGHSLADARITKNGRACRKCARETQQRRNARARQERIDAGWDPNEYKLDRRSYFEKRGKSLQKSECKHGHDLTDGSPNVRYINGDVDRRRCRACEAACAAAYRARRKADNEPLRAAA